MTFKMYFLICFYSNLSFPKLQEKKRKRKAEKKGSKAGNGAEMTEVKSQR